MISKLKQKITEFMTFNISRELKNAAEHLYALAWKLISIYASRIYDRSHNMVTRRP
jgi:hypothetical protein